ncbi:DUF4139 domain-containing protein, partial [Kitasatospora sp. NPDC058965]|uniref:DUF4139 domain-containing protein n=1 Tax=Kitasatospora sp. NPDC058965 TaxID=3346682 RepID=UPI0036BA0D9C
MTDWPTELDSVVVHDSGAVCLRLAGGRLPAPPAGAGPDAVPRVRLRLTGLPAVVEHRTLRAALPDGPPGWRITEVRTAATAEVGTTAELPALRRDLAAAEEELRALVLRARTLDDRIVQTAALRAVPPAPVPDAPAHRRAPAGALLALADFVAERLGALQARAEEVREQVELAEHRRDLLRDRVARSSTAARRAPVRTGTTVLVTLAADAPDTPVPTAPVTVGVEYRVPSARWYPSYRLDHSPGSGSGTLTLRAAVAQRTGEDWTGVRLALSTADLRRPGRLPELRSLRIGRRRPAPAPSGWREPPAGLDGLFADHDELLPRGFDRTPLPGTPAAAERSRTVRRSTRSVKKPADPEFDVVDLRAEGSRGAGPAGFGGAPAPAAPGGPAPRP